jgi:NADH-quinone oxidoreductase subunit N
MAYLSFTIVSALVLMVVTNLVSVFVKSKKLALVSTITLLFAASIASFIIMLSGGSFIFIQVFQADAFSALFFTVFPVAIAFIALLSYDYSADFETFSVLLSFVAVGVFLVTFAYSLIPILVGLEVVSLSSSFMIIVNGKKFVEPAVKLFLLSAISIAIFTFALAMLLPYDSKLVLELAGTSTIGKYLLGLSLILFAGALSLDAAAFPFNLWVPDVYEGSPANITALIAGINKKVSFVAILEIFVVVFAAYKFLGSSLLYSDIFLVLSVFTMFFGNLLALVQKNIKRLFAYSSISQAGYIFIGISVASHLGVEASIFYIFAHMFMIIGAFAIVMWLESKHLYTLDDYSGLNGINAFAAISLTIFMLSMAGIPPLVGFVGKFLLFSSSVYGNDVALALIGIINSFISIYYYAKVINQIFLKKPVRKSNLDRNVAIVVSLCLIFVIFFGVYPQPLINASSLAAKAIVGI